MYQLLGQFFEGTLLKIGHFQLQKVGSLSDMQLRRSDLGLEGGPPNSKFKSD